MGRFVIYMSMSDLELTGGEGAWVIPILVPEPVSLPQVEELLAQDAGKGGTCLGTIVKRAHNEHSRRFHNHRRFQ